MYLKSLELQGFKSFADKTVLEFKPGITAIIGPNGSGKSNIVDAIKWVLGEQSMKSLRGAKSEDVIFAGTQNRKSLGFAEVSMIIDNSDGQLPIEYNEVTVTRRLYRTGETNYFINKVPCRLKDITELFMDTGIGKDGYSVIGQGRIEEILSNKSEDRRRIFEEAAGIVKYRARRDETEKKLEQTKVNLIRINDILSEISLNIEPLKNQAEKAKKYLDLREELKKIEIGLYLAKIDDYKSKIEEAENVRKIFENQNIDENAKLNSLQQLKNSLKDEIDSIDKKIEEMQNSRFESKNQIEKINSEINVNIAKIKNNEDNKEKYKVEIEENKKNIEELKEEKENKELKKEKLKNNKEKFEKELKEKEKELEEITKKLSDKEIKNEENKKENENLVEEKYNLQNDITVCASAVENSNNRIDQIDKELHKVISNIDDKRNIKNEITNEKNEIETQAKSDLTELEKMQEKAKEIQIKNSEFETKIQNLVDEKRMKVSKHNFLLETEREKEGYIKSVKEIMNACEKNPELRSGTCGVLANIISTDPKYQVAIEMCLGASIQNIVTENENDAKNMIEFLRKNNLGRASFLPISSIKGRVLENIILEDGKLYGASKIKNEKGVIALASNLVKYDKKYENIIQNLLGRTIITDNVETAIKIARNNKYAFKIVTLEGDVINPSGAITGGSVQKKTVNILGRKAEINNLAEEIKKLDKQIEEIVTAKEKYMSENEKILKLIDELNKKSQESQIKLAGINEKYKAIENEIEKEISNKEKFENEKKTLVEQINKNNEEKSKIEEKIKEINQKSAELVEKISEFAEQNKGNQEKIDNLNTDITDLKISVSSFDESNISIDEMMQIINDNIKNEEDDVKNKEDEIKNIDEINKELANKNIELQKQIEQINNDAGEVDAKTEEQKNLKIEKDNSLEETEKKITDKFETIQKIKEGLAKAEANKESLNQKLTDEINELWNDYEITPNNAKENYEKTSNAQKTQQNVNEIHKKIKELGEVNVSAIEEYKKTKERYDNMNNQKIDLETTIEKLREIIEEMTSAMKKQFKEKFNKINKNFNEIFKELFGGGKAELILSNEENVLESEIEIRVQPTGKRLQNMMLLSGGEKALTAIALLFAILKINPAPFCILDEIEAALDDVNVYRYAEFLKKFSKETEFLVITHRKGSMEAANSVYGVTMEENGVSKILSISLKDTKSLKALNE